MLTARSNQTLSAGLLIFVAASNTTLFAGDVPTSAARTAAAEIRREASLPPNGPKGRPLPLASHWNVGTVPGTFDPDHQIGLLQKGHHVLPWMSWPTGDPDSDHFRQSHARLLTYSQH